MHEIYSVIVEARGTKDVKSGFIKKKITSEIFDYTDYFLFSKNPATHGGLQKIFDYLRSRNEVGFCRVEVLYYENINDLPAFVLNRLDRL